MLYPIPHFEWQVLRAVLRAEAAGEPALGRALRINMSRRSKDGRFLDRLVADGLLTALGRPEKANGREEPEQFRNRYRLTELGKHAAEYGEYNKQVGAVVAAPKVRRLAKKGGKR